MEGIYTDCKTEQPELKMKTINNENGIALVMVLILSTIALAIMAGMIYMVTQGTIISGVEKRYTTALEAGKAGVDVMYQLIGARGDPNIPYINLTITATTACLSDKLNETTSPTNWSNCSDFNDASSLTINPADVDTYDMTFTVGSYTVYSKIANTTMGNSGTDTELIKGSTQYQGEIQVQSIPFLYTLEVHSENPANPSERAKFSVLYQY